MLPNMERKAMLRHGTTIQDVAREAGVSKTTAASILRDQRGFQVSPETRIRVYSAAARLGYRRNALAAALSSGRTHTIGILLPPLAAADGSALMNSFGHEIFVAIFEAASQAGLRVTPAPQHPGPDGGTPLQHLIDGRVDGLVLVSLRDKDFVDEIYASGVPCVEMSSGFGKRLIHPDNEGGTAAAVRHLVGMGHRRIAYWGAGQSSFSGEHRRNGFLLAAEEHGLSPAETPLVSTPPAVSALLRLPSPQRPTALVAFNDHQAFITLDIARGIGLRVPEDLSVVGFDNKILAEAARPKLTTVHNPLKEQAAAAVIVLEALWKGEEDPPIPLPIPTYLVLRESTGPPAFP